MISVIVILVTLLQHASRASSMPPGKTSCSNRLAGEVVCCKSHTVLLNMIAFHDGLCYGNEGSSGFP